MYWRPSYIKRILHWKFYVSWVGFEHSSGRWTYRIKLWLIGVPGQVTGLQQSALCASLQPLACQKLWSRVRGWHFLNRSVRSWSQPHIQRTRLCQSSMIELHKERTPGSDSHFDMPSLRFLSIFGKPYVNTLKFPDWATALFTIEKDNLTKYRIKSLVLCCITLLVN